MAKLGERTSVTIEFSDPFEGPIELHAATAAPEMAGIQ
jgi:hypothetical protein